MKAQTEPFSHFNLSRGQTEQSMNETSGVISLFIYTLCSDGLFAVLNPHVALAAPATSERGLSPPVTVMSQTSQLGGV